MTYDPDRHHRRSIRLPGYNYSQPGAYFITICVHERRCVLGSVANGVMNLSAYGKIAASCWESIPEHFPHVQLDAFVIMPDHMHGILILTEGQADSSSREPERFAHPVSGSLATVVRAYKSAATRSINVLRDTPGAPFWQRNYYERIIRDQVALRAIREYIIHNTLRWHRHAIHPRVPSKW